MFSDVRMPGELDGFDLARWVKRHTPEMRVLLTSGWPGEGSSSNRCLVDHGDDVPPGLSPGPAGAKQYVGGAYRHFPDIHVTIEDMIAEDDKVVVRNRWTGTEAASGQRLEFSGIVIWRIAGRQIHERWAYLQKPHPSAG